MILWFPCMASLVVSTHMLNKYCFFCLAWGQRGLKLRIAVHFPEINEESLPPPTTKMSRAHFFSIYMTSSFFLSLRTMVLSKYLAKFVCSRVTPSFPKWYSINSTKQMERSHTPATTTTTIPLLPPQKIDIGAVRKR